MSVRVLYSGEAWIINVIGRPPRFALLELDPDQSEKIPQGFKVAVALAITTDTRYVSDHYEFPHWSNVAALLCKQREFQDWLQVDSEEAAADKVRTVLCIESRAWLDGSPAVVDAFVTRFYAPFHGGTEFR